MTIDLRSDTVTAPTDGMRRAMAAAEVGDDVYGEDPSVIALEERVAALFGHEAAVFVPSGTMGNQIGIRLVVPPGGELLCDADAHIVTYEGGGAAQHGAIQTRTVAGPLLDVDAYLAQVRAHGWGALHTSAVAVEQTHNRGGGLVHSFEDLAELRKRTTAAGGAALRRGTDLERLRRDRRHVLPVRRLVRHPLGLPVEGVGCAGRLARRDV